MGIRSLEAIGSVADPSDRISWLNGYESEVAARQIVEFFWLHSFVFGALFRNGEHYRYLVGCEPRGRQAREAWLQALDLDELDVGLLRKAQEHATAEEAARELDVTLSRAKSRYERLARKLEVPNKRSAVEKAVALGLIRGASDRRKPDTDRKARQRLRALPRHAPARAAGGVAGRSLAVAPCRVRHFPVPRARERGRIARCRSWGCGVPRCWSRISIPCRESTRWSGWRPSCGRRDTRRA